MREIKFRAWDETEKRMIGWHDRVFTKNNNSSLLCEYPLKNISESYVKYMQYTGLNDKNGKEIYEGDILKVTTVRGDTRWQMEVDFENGCFSLKEGPELWKLKYDYPNHEVIGNIYENPELLKN